jgi:hypothetical protein
MKELKKNIVLLNQVQGKRMKNEKYTISRSNKKCLKSRRKN